MSHNNTDDSNAPPLVPGLPFFGNSLAMKRHPLKFLVNCAAKYGNIFRLSAPGETVTVLTGPEGRDLVQNDVNNGLHRKGIFQAFSTEAGVDIFGVQGDQHARLRQLVKYGYSRQIPSQFVGDMEKALVREIGSWHHGRQEHLFNVTSRLSLFCMMPTVTPIDLQDYADDIIYFGNNVMYAVTKLKPSFILWAHKYRRRRDRVYSILEEIIARHESGEFSEHPNLYMVDAFLQAKNKHGDQMAKRDVRGGCCYALCGTEIYVGRLAGFMLFEILRDPELYAKIRSEVDAAFGRRKVDPQLFRRMPYLRATYFETLRSYPLLPGLPFKADKDLEIKGYTIPKGQLVLISPLPAHFSAKNYHNPFQFDVNRCMAPRNEHLKPGAFAPFGSGTRTCAAAGLVEIITLTCISVMIRDLQMELVREDQEITLSPNPLISSKRKLPMRITGKRIADASNFKRSLLLEESDLTSPIEEEREAKNLPDVVPINIKSGKTIIEEGANPDFFYILLDGSVIVRKKSQDSLDTFEVARLKPGRCFGEIGLLKGVPRTATVVADTDVRLLRIDRDTFMDWVSKTDLTGAELGTLLQKRYMLNVFSKAMPKIDAGSLKTLHADWELRHYPRQKIIIREGDPSLEAFIIANGEVDILKKDRTGNIQKIASLSAGQFFGEIGILGKKPRTATVRAKTDVDVLCLPQNTFIEILNASGQTREDVSLTIGRRLLSLFPENEKTQNKKAS